MHWKITALAFGWRLARDDEEDLFVVYHPTLGARPAYLPGG
ncbi:hypothetical protein [Rhizobium sp. CCGE 510]|nr:hypothetical protein [Rhizobium sp. CCGE 510]